MSINYYVNLYVYNLKKKKKKKKGFEHLVISTTGFSKLDRLYVSRLITAIGKEFIYNMNLNNLYI